MKASKRVHQGVYAMLGGPNFETVAELKMLRICGVDAVGEIWKDFSWNFVAYFDCFHKFG